MHTILREHEGSWSVMAGTRHLFRGLTLRLAMQVARYLNGGDSAGVTEHGSLVMLEECAA